MLPVFITADRNFIQMQNQWSTQLNPLLNNPLMNGVLVQNVSLINGVTAVNHTLNRPLIGWFITRKRSSANIYDTQSANPLPQLTLNLVSDMPALVDIYVF